MVLFCTFGKGIPFNSVIKFWLVPKKSLKFLNEWIINYFTDSSRFSHIWEYWNNFWTYEISTSTAVIVDNYEIGDQKFRPPKMVPILPQSMAETILIVKITCFMLFRILGAIPDYSGWNFKKAKFSPSPHNQVIWRDFWEIITTNVLERC